METTNPFDSYLAKHEGVLDNQPSLDDEALLDAYVEKKQKKNDEELQILLNNVRNNDPDNTGETQRLAERLGLPKGTVINNSDTLESLKAKIIRAKYRS